MEQLMVTPIHACELMIGKMLASRWWVCSI